MKKLKILSIIFLFLLSACNNNQPNQHGAENILQQEWKDTIELASGTEVNIFMWGGDEGINSYIDDWVAPRLLEQHDIILTRTPMDTENILQKLLTEKKAGKDSGTIDVIWVNGENFKNAKENELLLGAFSNKLPNVQQYVDLESLDVQYDFGTPTENMEAPWGKVQFVLAYNSANIAEPPRTFAELKVWVKENEGKFTYPEASDFTGNAFLRHLMYEAAGGVNQLLSQSFDEQYINTQSQEMWTYLRDIKPFLWRSGETYPQDLAALDRLYSDGEVWMTMGYNEARVESLIEKGIFPDSTKTFVFDSGSIGNTHFLTIPYNSTNVAGAMVAINYLLSPEAQLKKMEPSMWGENMALDPTKLSEDLQKQLRQVNRGDSVLSSEVLKDHLLPEVDSLYVNWVKETWQNEVVQTP
ncbi:ABC transporter substrate-binding protein [Cytobacillus sp. IB215665]|uniref:ABC transporter substrate-binding protein n=1 Tax=Cytobacillus sp. IB215665 TaxID=3097357 RepID=UPI002A0DFE58|nr:ABC transporter substrate-binding protein [Cytobacillus sp. IB215665]MDX8364386.1 ABC transporter substrate-binding protein [Cytobacillus sp. IB215665]